MTTNNEQGQVAVTLLPCPFCGDAMHMAYDPKTGYFGPDADHQKGCMFKSVDLIDFADEQHAAALWNRRASTATVVEAEPVAWMYSNPDFKDQVGLKRQTEADWANGWTETPLYAHPAATKALDLAAVERVAKAIHAADKPVGSEALALEYEWVMDMRLAQARAAIAAMQPAPDHVLVEARNAALDEAAKVAREHIPERNGSVSDVSAAATSRSIETEIRAALKTTYSASNQQESGR